MLGRWVVGAAVISAVVAGDARAASVFVGTFSGKIFRVDPDGSAALLATAAGPIGGVARGPNGRMYACVQLPPAQVQVIESDGTLSNVGTPLPAGHNCGQLAVAANGRIFLVEVASSEASVVWEVFANGQPSLQLFTLFDTLLEGHVAGFDLTGDGTFVIATQEQTFGRILSVTPGGHVTTLVTAGLLNGVSVDSAGQIVVLAHETSGPHANNRSLRRLEEGVLLVIAGADVIGDELSRVSSGEPGEYFVAGGGFGTSIAIVQRVLSDGTATLLRAFPEESITSLDDDHFEVSVPPAEVPIISELFSTAGLIMVGAFAAVTEWTLRRRRGARRGRR